MTKKRFTRLASRLWPDLPGKERCQRKQGLVDRCGVVVGAPLLLFGLGWLSRSTTVNLDLIGWIITTVLLLMGMLLTRSSFFVIVERRAGTVRSYSSTLSGLLLISSLLLFGSAALWFIIVGWVAMDLPLWYRSPLPAQRWHLLSTFLMNLSAFLLGSLTGLTVYQWLGGQVPLPGLAPPQGLFALVAVLAIVAIRSAVWFCYALLLRWTALSASTPAQLLREALFSLLAALPEFFAILVAAVYSQMGLVPYLLLIGGIFGISESTNRYSQAATVSAQRSRELAHLEQLGRAIIAAPPNLSSLPQLLAIFVPNILPYAQVEIWLRPNQLMLRHPDSDPLGTPLMWSWLCAHPQAQSFAVGQILPWIQQPSPHPVALAPILSTQTATPLGYIYVVPSGAVSGMAAFSVGTLPALQTLAAQIASAVHRTDEYARTLAYQRVAQELALARQVQMSLIPAALPSPPGWQLSACLKPARETSGDFYDVLTLPNGCLGLVIADVADKGMGPALFMALTRTLIRTYAFEYLTQPDAVLGAVNRRMLMDADTSLFVTAFYGILDLQSGWLTYANAGHNPPYVLRRSRGTAPLTLNNTGIPLGIEVPRTWPAKIVEIAPGDRLVLYTDGVTEAQNQQREFFGEQRLLAVTEADLELSADQLLQAILTAVEQFEGDATQYDDITLMILARADQRSARSTSP